MTAAESQRKRQANLRAFVKEFHESIDSAFAQQEQELHQKLLTLVSGLQFQARLLSRSKFRLIGCTKGNIIHAVKLSK